MFIKSKNTKKLANVKISKLANVKFRNLNQLSSFNITFWCWKNGIDTNLLIHQFANLLIHKFANLLIPQRFHQLHFVIECDLGDGVEVAHPEFDGGECFVFGFAGELRFAQLFQKFRSYPKSAIMVAISVCFFAFSKEFLNCSNISVSVKYFFSAITVNFNWLIIFLLLLQNEAKNSVHIISIP